MPQRCKFSPLRGLSIGILRKLLFIAFLYSGNLLNLINLLTEHLRPVRSKICTFWDESPWRKPLYRRLNDLSDKSKTTKLDNEMHIENEVSWTRDVAQWKPIRLEERFQKRIYIKFNNTLYECQYKLLNVSEVYILHCSINRGVCWRKGGMWLIPDILPVYGL